MEIIERFYYQFLVTPLDVVKTRLQAQQSQMSNKCFLYCNGLMDHLCPCDPKFPNAKTVPHLNGTIVCMISSLKVCIKLTIYYTGCLY